MRRRPRRPRWWHSPVRHDRGPVGKIPGIRRISVYRARFNELAAAVAEARELAREAATGIRGLREELVRVAAGQEQLAAELGRLSASVAALEAEQPGFRADVLNALKHIHADEARHRRRLRQVRETPEYAAAFTDAEPLVSVLIATYERLGTLRERTIPSILAQEYRNFEIVIVGDNAPYGAAEVLEGFERAPIRYENLTVRGPYPDDAKRRWLVAGTPPFNQAMHLARGAWLAPFADDDAMRPHHMRVLLERAQADRLEFVYGMLMSDLSGETVGSFPPKLGEIGLQGALLHGALSFFEVELSDADFNVPNDWGLIERMLRAGVRVGMVDDVVTDWFPSPAGFA
jgi:hypothetical protein